MRTPVFINRNAMNVVAKTITVYHQIDYILWSEKIKQTLISARSFSGTETSCDHRLVICKLQVEKYNVFKNISKIHSNNYNTFQLIKSEETKNGYQQQFHEKFCKITCTSKGNIRSSITNAAAKETIDFSKNKNYRIHNLVERLSNQQEEFRLCISTTVSNAIH